MSDYRDTRQPADYLDILSKAGLLGAGGLIRELLELRILAMQVPRIVRLAAVIGGLFGGAAGACATIITLALHALLTGAAP